MAKSKKAMNLKENGDVPPGPNTDFSRNYKEASPINASPDLNDMSSNSKLSDMDESTNLEVESVSSSQGKPQNIEDVIFSKELVEDLDKLERPPDDPEYDPEPLILDQNILRDEAKRDTWKEKKRKDKNRRSTASSRTDQEVPCRCSGGRVISFMYAMIVFMLATLFPISEALSTQWMTQLASQIYLAYMLGISCLFVVFLELFTLITNRYQQKQAKQELDLEVANSNRHNEAKANTSYEGNIVIISRRTPPGDRDVTPGPQPEVYTQHQSPPTCNTSLYMRIGTAIFGLASMVYFGLLVKQLHEHKSPSGCSDRSAIWPYYLLLVFLLAQTYVIIKRAQVLVTKWVPLFRLGFMHMLATNWCIWVRTFTREVYDAYLHHQMALTKPSLNINIDRGNTSDTMTTNTTFAPKVDSDSCDVEGDMLYMASPYLYPCVLEYSLLAAAIMYTLFTNLRSQCACRHRLLALVGTQRPKIPEPPSELKYGASMEINFHKTHKGLFMGIVLMAATCVSVIVVFSYLGSDEEIISMLIYHISDITLHALLLTAVSFGWGRIQRLEVVRMCDVTVSEILITVAVSGVLLLHLFKIYALFDTILSNDAKIHTVLSFTSSLLSILFCVVQSGFLLDSLSRYSTCAEDIEDKPGRGSITFLGLGNIALWAFRTFLAKELDREGNQEEQLYGFLAWELIARSMVPLVIFYYFYVSSCLAHIWSKAYKDLLIPGESSPTTPKRSSQLRDSWGIFPESPTVKLVEVRRRVRSGEFDSVENILTPISEV